MATMLFELTVEMDNGNTYVVVADQRDIAKWEVQPFGGPFSQFEDKAMTAMRFLAWSASVRQTLTPYTKWDDFNEHCIESVPVDDEDDAEDTNPLGNGGQTSPSDSPTSP